MVTAMGSSRARDREREWKRAREERTYVDHKYMIGFHMQ